MIEASSDAGHEFEMGQEGSEDLLVDGRRPQRAVHEEDDVDAALLGDALHVLDHLLPGVVGDELDGGDGGRSDELVSICSRWARSEMTTDLESVPFGHGLEVVRDGLNLSDDEDCFRQLCDAGHWGEGR